MVDVRIKPLKWEQDEYGCYHAETEIGEYIAWPNGRAQFGPFRTTHVNGGEKGAMAAGEADYERRIRSTLSDAVAEREAEPVAFPECVLGLIGEKITLVFESPEDARLAFGIIEYTISSPPTSELEALRKRVAELEKPSREKFYYPIVMPVDADGQGPADLKDAAKLTWEVWDQELMSHGSFDFLADAIDLANELNARRVREGGKVE